MDAVAVGEVPSLKPGPGLDHQVGAVLWWSGRVGGGGTSSPSIWSQAKEEFFLRTLFGRGS